MLFAGSLGECNVEEFEEHLAANPKRAEKTKIHVIPVSHDLTFQWNHSNLDRGIKHGYENTLKKVKKYLAEKKK